VSASLAALTRSVLGRTGETWRRDSEWDACCDALRELAQPLLAGSLAVSGALFAALLVWRRRGASVA
jgi:hypothetical protein